MFDDNSRPPYFLVVDLEATCSDDGIAVPRDEMEIIEIGALMIHGRTLDSVSEFQSFVRPVRNPLLTDFCRKLTGITQSEVNAAPECKHVLGEFVEWFSKHPGFLFCSWRDSNPGSNPREIRIFRRMWFYGWFYPSWTSCLQMTASG